jgi:chemotaxis protein methyltransferase CheR
MRRRLTTLRMKHGFSSFAAYYAAIVRDARLLGEFLDRMTINVSEFWRNPNRWHLLKERFLEPLARRPGHLAVWSAACSTGEEPYTLAMLLDSLEALERTALLATDIDENALAKAREGVYAERSVRDVPTEYLKRYFKLDNGVYRVADKLRQAVRFQRQNLLLDPFEGRYDLIVCRNVVIYFTEEAKAGLYRKFAQALKPDGILFVGSTEQIFNPGQYGLEAADSFFYRRADAGV